MLNIWGYLEFLMLFVLPITGVFVLLFPNKTLYLKNRFPIVFSTSLLLAFLSQIALLVGVWGVQLKYIESTGLIKTFAGQGLIIVLILFILVLSFSLYFQSKRLDRNRYKNTSFSIALYAAFTVSAPLYFLLVEITDRLFA